MSGWVFFETRKLQSVQRPACHPGCMRCIVEAGVESSPYVVPVGQGSAETPPCVS